MDNTEVYVQTEKNVNEKWSQNIRTLSVICSILIILIHTYNTEQYGINSGVTYWLEIIISQNLSRIAVPFFYISSAFLLYKKKYSYKYVLQTRSRSVLVPFFIWNALYMFSFFILGLFGLVENRIVQFSFYDIFQELFFYRSNYTFWFIYQLILLILLYPIISYTIKVLKNKSIILWLVMIIIYLFFGDFIPYNGPHLLCFSALIYYYLGAILGTQYSNNMINVTEVLSRYKAWLFIIGLSLGTLMFIFIDVLKIKSFVNCDLIRNISLLYVLYFIVDHFDLSIGGWISKITFLIYAIHPIVLESIEKVFFRILPKSSTGALIDYIVAPILSLILIWIITKIWHIVLPRSYRICSGGRSTVNNSK